MSGGKCSTFSTNANSRGRSGGAGLTPQRWRGSVLWPSPLKCKALEHFDFGEVDICLMSAGGAVSKEWSPKIGAAGAVVIDNSSAWRMDPDVPLIVPEVTADAVTGFTKKNIIANPNCSTAQLVVALKPLHDQAPSSASWSRLISRCRAPARTPWTNCSRRPRPSTPIAN